MRGRRVGAAGGQQACRRGSRFGLNKTGLKNIEVRLQKCTCRGSHPRASRGTQTAVANSSRKGSCRRQRRQRGAGAVGAHLRVGWPGEGPSAASRGAGARQGKRRPRRRQLLQARARVCAAARAALRGSAARRRGGRGAAPGSAPACQRRLRPLRGAQLRHWLWLALRAQVAGEVRGAASIWCRAQPQRPAATG